MSILEITNENFKTEVTSSEKAVLIDFWASWCGPCAMVSPLIDQIAELRDNCKVCKVNVDNEPELTSQFGVTSIPTLIIIKNGIEAERIVGYAPLENILEMVDKHI